MYIHDRPSPKLETLPDRGRDVLKADKINALQQPILVRLCGGWEWEAIDFEVETALLRINVAGLPEVKSFVEVMEITDGDGVKHDPEDFWHEEAAS